MRVSQATRDEVENGRKVAGFVRKETIAFLESIIRVYLLLLREIDKSPLTLAERRENSYVANLPRLEIFFYVEQLDDKDANLLEVTIRLLIFNDVHDRMHFLNRFLLLNPKGELVFIS